MKQALRPSGTASHTALTSRRLHHNTTLMNNISKTLVESSKDNQDVVRIKAVHISLKSRTKCLRPIMSLSVGNVQLSKSFPLGIGSNNFSWKLKTSRSVPMGSSLDITWTGRKKSVKVSLPHGEIASILDKDSGDYEYSNDKITVKVLFQKDCVHVFPTASGMSSPSTQTEVCVSANEPRGSESGMLHAEDVSCSAGIPAVPLPVSSSSQSRRTSSGVALVMYRMRRFTAVLKKNRLVNEPESTPLIATDIPTICRLPRGPSPRNFAVIHVEAVALGGARDAVNGVNPVGGPSCSGSTPFVEQSINNGPGVFNKVAGDQYNNNNNNNLYYVRSNSCVTCVAMDHLETRLAPVTPDSGNKPKFFNDIMQTLNHLHMYPGAKVLPLFFLHTSTSQLIQIVTRDRSPWRCLT